QVRFEFGKRKKLPARGLRSFGTCRRRDASRAYVRRRRWVAALIETMVSDPAPACQASGSADRPAAGPGEGCGLGGGPSTDHEVRPGDDRAAAGEDVEGNQRQPGAEHRALDPAAVGRQAPDPVPEGRGPTGAA